MLVGSNACEHEHAGANNATCVCRARIWPSVMSAHLTALLINMCGMLRLLMDSSLTDAEHDGVKGPEAFAQLIFSAGAVQLLLGIFSLD